MTSVKKSNATWLFCDALGCRNGHRLSIICDEFSSTLCSFLVSHAESLGIECDELRITDDQLNELANDATLPRFFREHLDRVDRIVLLQERRDENNAFRMKVIDYCRQDGNDRRVAAMPGFDLNLFDYCSGDLNEIERRCTLVVDALLQAREARIITVPKNPTRHFHLTVPLGTYRPIPSTGRVPERSWCNVPSGEAFIVPDFGAAHGEIAIDGSILHHVISSDEELHLRIEDGRICSCGGEGDVVDKFWTLMFNESGTERWPDCSLLAELGIGTNSKISQLVGLPIIDEKMLGTIHLGFGRNKQFGGPIQCDVHRDFVVKTSTLYLDNMPIVQEGRFVLEEKHVYADWRDESFLSTNLTRRLKVGIHACEIDEDGRLMIDWISPRSGSRHLTPVGNRETAQLAAKLYDRIDVRGATQTIKSLSRQLGSEVDCVGQAVELMVRMRAVSYV